MGDVNIDDIHPSQRPKGMARSGAEMQRDLATESNLYLHRKPIEEIARLMGLTYETVRRDLVKVRESWLQMAREDFGQRQADELARIDHLETVSWEAWDRSIGEVKSSQKEVTEETKGTKTKARITKKDVGGDPRFLDKVAWCINKRCEILGLNAPIRTEETHGIIIAQVSPELVQGLVGNKSLPKPSDNQVIDG